MLAQDSPNAFCWDFPDLACLFTLKFPLGAANFERATLTRAQPHALPAELQGNNI